MTDVRTAVNRHIEIWLDELVSIHAAHKEKYIGALVKCTDRYALMPVPVIPFLRQNRHDLLAGIGVLLSRFLPIAPQVECDDITTCSKALIEKQAELDLIKAGKLFRLQRMAGFEREGLFQSEQISVNHYAIRAIIADTERFERQDEEWIVRRNRSKTQVSRNDVDQRIFERLNNVNIHDYANVNAGELQIRAFDPELFTLSKMQASFLWSEYNESSSFPDDAVLGSRTFGEWREICQTAAANINMYLLYAGKARAEKMTGAENLMNNLTRFVGNCFESGLFQAGPDDTRDFNTEDVHDIFFLNAEDAKRLYDEGEIPLPYGIKWGNGLVLPVFGYLGNMTYTLVNNLRSKFKDDWQAMVDLREPTLQAELASLFKDSNHTIGKWNLNITTLHGNTDTDGAIYELESNCLYIFQLKCPDVWARNLNQRRNRLHDLAKANKWIERLNSWIKNTPKSDIVLGLELDRAVEDIEGMTVRLFVVCQSDTRISTATDIYNRDAAWVSWPRLQRLVLECKTPNQSLEHAYNECAKLDVRQHVQTGKHTVFEFKNLLVDFYE
jgi:hypothetical protein